MPADAVALFETLNPEDVAVVVVEDGGEIVAQVGVVRAAMLEYLRVSPAAFGNAGIARMLMRGAAEAAAAWTPHWAIAHAAIGGDGIREMLERIGGQWLPVHTFMLPLRRVEEEATCPL